MAAVLWDLDGTLIDTEPCWIAEEHELVGAYGGTWDRTRAESLVGLELIAAAKVIRDLGSVALTPEAIVDRLQSGVVRRIRDAMPWRPGARELLAEAAAAGVPCALVTMSWTEVADEVVAALPAGTFSAVVTGDVVRRGKPDAEPYLVALERLGVSARRCVAIEDSPVGVTAAVAAAIPTVAVPNTVAVPPMTGVVHVSTLAGVTLGDLRRLRDEALDRRS